jgi:hypothetical protein
VFDRPVTLNPPPHVMDDAIQVNDGDPITVAQAGANVLALEFTFAHRERSGLEHQPHAGVVRHSIGRIQRERA